MTALSEEARRLIAEAVAAGRITRIEIGDGIARVRASLGPRFSIRHSGRTGRWGSFTVDFPASRRRIGDAIVCPEQADAMNGKSGRHCGTCCLCWQSDLPIVFVEH